MRSNLPVVIFKELCIMTWIDPFGNLCSKHLDVLGCYCHPDYKCMLPGLIYNAIQLENVNKHQHFEARLHF